MLTVMGETGGRVPESPCQDEEVDSDELQDLGAPSRPAHARRDSWRAGRIEMVHVRFGGERLVFLGNQDPASYPTGIRRLLVTLGPASV